MAFHGALVYPSAAQTISNITSTAIAFDTQEYATDGNIHITDEVNTRLTVIRGFCWARLWGGLGLLTDATTDDRGASFWKNGAVFRGSSRYDINTQTAFRNNIACPLLSVVPGDYFELIAFHAAGGDLDTEEANTWFAIELFKKF